MHSMFGYSLLIALYLSAVLNGTHHVLLYRCVCDTCTVE